MDETLKQTLALGRSHFENRRYAEADQCLSQVVTRGQAFADVHWMLGVIYYEQGHLERAVWSFQAALRINPSYTEAALNLAVAYNDLGKYGEAKEIYEDALARRKATPGKLDGYVKGKVANLYAQIGDMYAASGLWEEAIGEYHRALKLGPQFVDIRLKLADACRELGMLEVAISEYEEIVRQKPDYLPGRLRHGMALYSKGQTAEARKVWGDVLAQNPGNKSAELYLKLPPAPARG